MNAEQSKQVGFLFEKVGTLNISEKKAYLDENCTDPEVRKEVEALLARDKTASQFFPKDQTHKDTEVVKPPNQTSPMQSTEYEKNIEEKPISLEAYFNDFIGKKLNNTYLIEEKLGEGGMGVVFRATHLLLGNNVAIKIMTPELRKNSNDVKRFQREARVGWALSHPNIIKVLEFSQTQEGTLFMVMEFVKGEDLKSYIKRLAPLSISRCIELLKPLCDALDMAHKRNIIHRDLKPANILISEQNGVEIVKLADFGIVKLLKPDNQITAEGTALTDTGTIIGSLNYMSPEQLMDYNLGPTSDIYSLGVILHEMLTRDLPIKGGDLRKVLSLKTNYHLFPLPSTSFSFLPTTLDKVLRKVLSAMPQQRYQKAGELLEALRECL